MSKKHISVIDLVGNYESGPVIKDKKPNHVISYSEDGEQAEEPMALGKGFTKRKKRLKKEALGLFDVPYGSTITNVSHRQRDSYKEQDKEVAQRFFGGESNLDSEESGPPANIDRVDKKEPINILEENEINDFFSFLRIKPKAKHKKLGEKMNQDHLELNKLASALRAKGFDAQANSVLSLTKVASGDYKANFEAAREALRLLTNKLSSAISVTANGVDLYEGDDAKGIRYLANKLYRIYGFSMVGKEGSAYFDKTPVKDVKDRLSKMIESFKSIEEFAIARFPSSDPAIESKVVMETLPSGTKRPKALESFDSMHFDAEWQAISGMDLFGGQPYLWAYARKFYKKEFAAFVTAHDAFVKALDSAGETFKRQKTGSYKWNGHNELLFTREVIGSDGSKLVATYSWRASDPGQSEEKPPCNDDSGDCLERFGDDPVSHPEFKGFFKLRHYKEAKASSLSNRIMKFAAPRPPRDPEKGTFAPVDANDKTKGYRATDKDGKVATFKTEAEAKAYAEGKKAKPTTPTRQLTPMSRLTNGLITNTKSGNEFRQWVNKERPEVARKRKLDPENNTATGWRNSYIRNAWNDVGEEYIAFKTKEQGSVGKKGPAGSQLAKGVSDETLIGYMLLPKGSTITENRDADKDIERLYLNQYFGSDSQPTANAEAMAKRMLKDRYYGKAIRKAYDEDLKATPNLEDTIGRRAFERQEAATQAGESKKKRDEEDKAKASRSVNVNDFYVIPEGGTGSIIENGALKVGAVLVGKQGEHLGRMFFVGMENGKIGLRTIRQRYTGDFGNEVRSTTLTDEEEEALKEMIKREKPNQFDLWKKFLSEKADFDQRAAGGRRWAGKSVKEQREERDKAFTALQQSDPQRQKTPSGTIPMPGTRKAPVEQS